MQKWEYMVLERIQNVDNYTKKLEGKRWADFEKGDDEDDTLRLNEYGRKGWQVYQVDVAREVQHLGKGYANLTTYYLRRPIPEE